MGKVSTSPQIPQPLNATPQRILATLQGYRDAAALNTAIELDLFTRIAHGTDTAHKIAGETGIPLRGINLLCEYLAATGILEKEDERLKLADDAAHYLDRNSPSYIGTAMRVLFSPELLRSYERLTESVRAGVAFDSKRLNTPCRPEWFDAARGVIDPELVAERIASVLNLPSGQPLKILDVGAEDGRFGIALCCRYPEAIIVALDRPETLKTAQTKAIAARLGTRYQNIPGDPLEAPLGVEYDAAILGCILHRFEQSQISTLLMRLHYTLKKTGKLFIVDALSDDRTDLDGQFAGFRLNMLAATARGDIYSLAQIKSLLTSAGFRSIEAQPIPDARAVLVTAEP